MPWNASPSIYDYTESLQRNSDEHFSTPSSKMETIYKGMDLAKMQHMAIGKEVHTCLDMGHVISAGPCLYAVIQDVMLCTFVSSMCFILQVIDSFIGYTRRQVLWSSS